jgi:hypothetical protein
VLLILLHEVGGSEEPAAETVGRHCAHLGHSLKRLSGVLPVFHVCWKLLLLEPDRPPRSLQTASWLTFAVRKLQEL